MSATLYEFGCTTRRRTYSSHRLKKKKKKGFLSIWGKYILSDLFNCGVRHQLQWRIPISVIWLLRRRSKHGWRFWYRPLKVFCTGEGWNCSSEFSPHGSQNYRQTGSRCQAQIEQAFSGNQIPILNLTTYTEGREESPDFQLVFRRVERTWNTFYP